MIRTILTLCCLGLFGGAIAGSLLGACDGPAGSATGGFVWRLLGPGGHSAGDRYLGRQHSLPLVADAEEMDDTEELSDRDKAPGTHFASRHSATGPSPRAARFEAAIQRRPANTLNALGVRLQI